MKPHKIKYENPKQLKENHVYCEYLNGVVQVIPNDKLEKGKEYSELPIVAGGSSSPNFSAKLLRVNIPLCEKHLRSEHKTEFVVETCSGFKFIAIPIARGIEQCRECNSELFLGLQGIYLSHADLSYADLSYANLSYANLRSADLSSANLRSADLRSADLSYADLRSADLSSADLRSADLNEKYKGLFVGGTKYSIVILIDFVQWGCRKMTFDELRKFNFSDCKEVWDEKEFNYNKQMILNLIDFYRS